jgi:hypothetical protein
MLPPSDSQSASAGDGERGLTVTPAPVAARRRLARGGELATPRPASVPLVSAFLYASYAASASKSCRRRFGKKRARKFASADSCGDSGVGVCR